MIELKPLSKENISTALEKATRYRLLNEPNEAESICLDILEIDPENQNALVTLLLALTDQFDNRSSELVKRARDRLTTIQGEYEKLYYEGIIWEREAKSILKLNYPGSKFKAFELLQKALDCFNSAERIRPKNNDESILRWNSCARIINQKQLVPQDEDYVEPFLE